MNPGWFFKVSISKKSHILIIGGGIVGLAIAFRLLVRFPGIRVTVLEKERELAFHQTGRNSGVLHAAPYYKPNSSKALLCRAGLGSMTEFAREQGIPYEICGKVIVAKEAFEEERLGKLFLTALQNGVDCELIGREALLEREPHVRGTQAILVHDTGIIDYRAVANRLAELIAAADGEICLATRVIGFHQDGMKQIVLTDAGEFRGDLVVNAGGLHSDRLCKKAGGRPAAKILPFRGEYFALKPEAHHLCNHLIYPVPDPHLPFLGVHFTRMIGGGRECGPNAVLAFAREGYEFWDFNARDFLETVTYRGFVRMAWHWRKVGLAEMYRSLSKTAFVRELQQFIPEVSAEMLVPAPAGIRAQAVFPDGGLAKDFEILKEGSFVHVINAPSPAATSSFAIADRVIDGMEV